MSGSLILNSLEIRNFRAFHHLCIERLGRVNLIAGKNNVGKTCLLEALLIGWVRQLFDL
jgi:AAA15 family ATPase/GTPase